MGDGVHFESKQFEFTPCSNAMGEPWTEPWAEEVHENFEDARVVYRMCSRAWADNLRPCSRPWADAVHKSLENMAH